MNVDHGPYRIAVSLTGFTAVNRDVVVNTGQNVDVPFQLKVASVEETVTVTAETPDRRHQADGHRAPPSPRTSWRASPARATPGP